MHVIVSFKDLYKIVNDFMDICKYVLYACTVQLKDLYKIVNSLTGCWTVMIATTFEPQCEEETLMI